MSTTKLIKTQAKKYLQNNWATAVAATLVLCVCAILALCIVSLLFYVAQISATTDIFNYISWIILVLLLAVIVLMMPFVYGYNRLFYKISKGETANISEMFRYVSDKTKYKKALAISFGSFKKFIPFFFLFFLISSVIYSVITSVFYWSNDDSVIIFFLPICLFVSLLASFLLFQKYSLAKFLFFENENIPVRDCFIQSKEIYSLEENSRIKLILSFFPWYLLLFFVLPLLYVLPYVAVSTANFSKWTLYNYLLIAKNFPSPSTYDPAYSPYPTNDPPTSIHTSPSAPVNISSSTTSITDVTPTIPEDIFEE